MDDKDRRILGALKTNARASLVSLARDIDLSRSATHDRLLRLEENGTIQNYTITVNDPDMFGAQSIFMVNFKSKQDNRSVAKRISKLAGVIATYCIAGDVDMLVHVECIDMQGLADLREDISAIDGVASIRAHTVLSVNGR